MHEILRCTECRAGVKASPVSLVGPKEDGGGGWADAQGPVGLLESKEKHGRELLVVQGPWSPGVTCQKVSGFYIW